MRPNGTRHHGNEISIIHYELGAEAEATERPRRSRLPKTTPDPGDHHLLSVQVLALFAEMQQFFGRAQAKRTPSGDRAMLKKHNLDDRTRIREDITCT